MLTATQPIQPRVVGFPPALSAPYGTDQVMQLLQTILQAVTRIERDLIVLRGLEKRQVRIETRLVTLMQHHGLKVDGWSGP